jgi:hypothetical protein
MDVVPHSTSLGEGRERLDTVDIVARPFITAAS